MGNHAILLPQHLSRFVLPRYPIAHFSGVEMALYLGVSCAFPNQPLLFFVRESFTFSDLFALSPGFVQ